MKKTANQIAQILSPREIQVLQLISDGESRDQISQQLNISKLTYDGYRKNIRMKLGIKSQADWVKVLHEMDQ
ncbi:response regulator transcription factor [Marinoscillum sp.]|uniref:response regulator transcription factor n=1 Tax=Marinoscillum sp. TaxID=2024838 RepID=UPI003BAD95E2